MWTGVAPIGLLDVWDRVICAVDGTPAGLRAPEEVACLMPEGGRLMVRALAEPGSRACARDLLDELVSSRATLVCVNNRRAGHVASLALEPIVLAMLHQARCSVLVLGEHHPAGRRDGAVVVGFDGTGGGFAALTIARELAVRRSAELIVVEDSAPSAATLVHAATEAQLLIVGSAARPRVTGGLGEKVVRRASCPVLIARGAPLGDEQAA